MALARRVAFLTMEDLGDFVTYDHLLIEPLAALGWAVDMVPWRKPETRWDDYAAVLIRSPWDYQEDAETFLRLLERIDRSSARLENPLALVRWNLHKSYLRELERRGAPIVPTIWGADLQTSDLPGLQARLGRQLVIKPTVGANADDTFIVPADARSIDPRVLDAFASREYMAQPFLEQICTEGEYSLFLFRGELSHAVRKVPKAMDFRVQEEHGARILAVTPEADLVEACERVMTALGSAPLYARVDLVRGEASPLLMELELIEPSLYFDFDPDSPQRFAEAFAAHMDNPATTAT